MRSPITASLLFALAATFTPILSKPLSPFNFNTNTNTKSKLHIRNAPKYSIIPVDGGAAAAAEAGGQAPPYTVTIVKTETVTERQEPRTITIVGVAQEHTQSQDAVTVTVTESLRAEETSTGGTEREKETIYVTIEAPPHRPTGLESGGGPPVIYIPTTIVETVLVPTTVVLQVGGETATWSTSTSIESSATSGETSAESTSTETATQTIGSETSTETEKTYDDGYWKTTYPPWSNSTVATGTPMFRRYV